MIAKGARCLLVLLLLGLLLNVAPFVAISFGAGKASYIILTFDDSLQQSVNDKSVTVMGEFGYRGVCNLAVDWTNVSSPIWQDLMAKGWEIGSHSWTHPFLDELSIQQLRHEIIDSKTYLEKAFNISIISFAYPNSIGSDNATILQVLSEAGYLYAREGEWHTNWDGTRSYKVNSWVCGQSCVPGYQDAIQNAIGDSKKNGISVLMFHTVVNSPNPSDDYALSTSQFRYCLQQIEAAGLTVITFQDLENMKKSTNISFAFSPNPSTPEQPVKLLGNLTESDTGSLINNTQVDVYSNGTFYTSLWTNSSGWFEYNTYVPLGTYVVNASYHGGLTYYPSSQVQTLIIQEPPVQWKLTVASGHDSPGPGVGDHLYNNGSSITCNVTSPVVEAGVSYNCTGWSGTGSVPSSGSDTSVTFTITKNSTVTWNWVDEPVQYGLFVGVGGSGTTNATGTTSYTAGTVVAVNATPALGWTLNEWLLNGSNVGSANPYSVTINANYNLTAVFVQVPPIQWKLTVASGHDSPGPGVGDHLYNNGSSINCSVTSPVTEGGVAYVCTGWSGTGSVPSSGSGTSVTFTIIQNSSIAWNWQAQWMLTAVSAHGSPSPGIGDHLYTDSSLVACSVASPVVEGGVSYTCTGWSGTGSVPPNGSDTSTNFTISQNSTIAWNWVVTPPVQWTLTVVSAHGNPSPGVGVNLYNDSSFVTCSVVSPVVESGITYTCTGWSGTGSVPSSGSVTSVAFTISQNSSITWNWHGSAVQWTLTVTSAHGNPSPAVGDHLYDDVDNVTCIVTSSVTEGGVGYVCSGWSGTGSVASSGSGTSVTFTMSENSSIAWNWQVVQWTLTVASAHGSPNPGIGVNLYNDSSSVICNVSSPVVESGISYTCVGWFGTGSVPSNGAGSSVTFSITQNSSITWNWQVFQWMLIVSSAHDNPNPTNGNHYITDETSVTCNVSSPVIEGNIVYNCTGWSGTGSVPSSGSDTSVTFTITKNSTITWNWVDEPVQYGLLVGVSGSGTTNATGTTPYNAGTVVAVYATPLSGWTLTNWLLNGTSVGSVNPYILTMNANYNLTALFVQVPPVQWKLSVSSGHDSPGPGVGDHLYNNGSSITCNVTSPVIEGGVSYNCTGWSGTGSVPSSGSNTSVTFTIAQNSTITWNWVVSKVDTQVVFLFSPNPAKLGDTVLLSGTLTNKLSGGPVYPAQVVVNYSMNGGTWIYYATLTTNSTGNFSQIIAPPPVGTYLVNVSFAGSSGYNRSSQTVTLTVQAVANVDTQVVFLFSPNPAKSGVSVVLSGNLTDKLGNPVYSASVVVDYSVDGGVTWAYVWTLSTNSSGGFSQTFTAPSAGSYLVRVSFAGSSGYNPSSQIVTLAVQT